MQIYDIFFAFYRQLLSTKFTKYALNEHAHSSANFTKKCQETKYNLIKKRKSVVFT